MLRLTLISLALATTLAACGQGGPGPDAGATAAATAQQPLLITQEDLMAVRSDALASGPVITGSLQPERRADLRAEVSAVVVQVLKDNGDKVSKGDVLVKLDETAIRESLASASEAARASEQAFDQAERQFQRLKALSGSGAVSAQALEEAEIRRNNAQSDLAAARTRVVQARQQMERTAVKAPFDGVVSERKVSAGDTAQVGKELLKVIDPRSMRFEGFVAADQIASVKSGQPVSFRVNGYDNQEFNGKIQRVNPTANAATRQVEVLVALDSGSAPTVSGLYAEGRVQTRSSDTLMVPESAVVREGDKAFVWRVKDNLLQKVAIELGPRDVRRGDYAVRSGIADGEQVLRHPQGALKDGAQVQMSVPAVATVGN